MIRLSELKTNDLLDQLRLCKSTKLNVWKRCFKRRRDKPKQSCRPLESIRRLQITVVH